MEFKFQNRENYDKSLKLKNTHILLYSKKMLKEVSPDANIVGEIVVTEKGGKDDEAESTIKLANKMFTVKENDSTNKLIYAAKGYIAVGENDYIKVFRNRLPFLLLLLLLLIIAGVAVVVIMNLPQQPVDNPINPLPPIDSNIQVDDTVIDSSSNAPEGGGSADISYKPTAVLTLSDGKIEMAYSNPKSSSHDAVLQLFVVSKDDDGNDQEYLVAKSGLIPHGNKIEVMTLIDDMKGLFSTEGIYEAKYLVSFYDSQTGEKAVIDSEMTDIHLKVVNN